MKILHLFSDWKWTGPSEPTLDLLIELQRRGHEVALACPEAGETPGRTLPGEANKAGVPLTEPIPYRKKLRLISNYRDARAIARWIDDRRFDLVHAHQTMDHLVGVAALKLAHHRPRLARTNHRTTPIRSSWVGASLLRGLTGGLFSFSRRFHGIDGPIVTDAGGRAYLLDPALRMERFARDVVPARIFSQEHFVVGMVLRVQKHRRMDIALEALRLAHRKVPHLRAVIVGRGTHREKLAVEPVRKMGLQDVIRFTGYVSEGYLETLASFDALLFLRPGSDGTARALREALAMGRPAVVSDFGMLGELVQDGKTGYVVPAEAEAVAERIVRLAQDRDRARSMGREAARIARERYGVDRQAEAVLRAYGEMIR
jgi:glycosyltransferase involved in cell wall biosynthesis